MSKPQYFLPPNLPNLPDDWIWVPLGKLLAEERGICYGIVQPGKHDPSGVPMINSGDILNNNPASEISFKVSKDLHEKFHRSSLRGGEILLTLVGANFGRSAVAPKHYSGYNCSRAVGVLPVLSDAEYITYALQTPLVRYYMNNWANTTAQPTFNLGDVTNLPIAWAPKNQREIIRNVISSLDRKIELNTQTNQTLESIAQAIFKSWFVDFEPVKAKMAALAEGGTREQAELAAMGAISGKSEAELAQLQQQNPEHYQQLAETAALFPSAMVESELGEIPEGWVVNNLGVISSLITKGTTPTKSDISSAEDEPKTFFLKVKDIAESGEVIRSGIEKIPTSVSMGALKRSILKADDVLFSIAGTIGRTAIADSDLNSANANQALAIIRLSNPKKWLSFTWFNINSDRIQNEIASKVVQGVQANASLANIRDITITMPSDEILEYFNKIIDPILLKKRLLAKNTRELSELRDSLLPKLLSGEIDLSESALTLALSQGERELESANG